MAKQTRNFHTASGPGRAAGKAVLSASLCALLTVGPVLAEGPMPIKPTTTPVAPVKLTEQEKALHALNRMTFGPRPGDVAAVEKMGLHAWFEQQLNPGSIDDSALNTMFLKFPAMQLTEQQLLAKFPSPQTLRQMARTNAPLPTDPVEHAIYADGMANYEAKLAAAGVDPVTGAVKTKKQAAAGAAPAMDGMNSMDAAAPVAGATAAAATMDGEQDMAMAGGAMPPAASASPAGKGKKRLRVAYSGDAPEAIVSLPPDERMAKIEAMSPAQANAFRRKLGGPETRQLMTGLSPEQLEVLAAMQAPIRVVGAETLETRILRDVYSDRQLEAVMTDFWLNHFSVYVRKNQNEAYFLPSYERDTIRTHALGKFEDLLVATAESPAMLMYLDNWQSVGPDSPAAQRGKKVQQFADANPNRPGLAQIAQATPKGINENYAREIIELHTIGVRCEVSADHSVKELDPSCGNGYTQADVTNLAKVLTGWTIDKPYQSGGGGFTFDERRHEGGSKQVLGKTINEGGQQEGLAVLHMLATSPATAQFISHKLAVRFVSDNPPVELENKMAKTFLSTDGDIKQVLRTMFNAPEFWAPAVYRAKVKTPIEFLASALRASDAKVGNALPLVQAMDRLGMPLYGMQTPNGYSWLAPEWVSTTALVSRMNFALVLSGDLLPGTQTDWAQLLGDPSAGTAAAPSLKTEHDLEMLLLGQPAAANTRAAVMEQSAKPGQAQEAVKSLALGVGGDADADGVDMASAGNKKGVLAKPGAKRPNYGGGGSMTDMASHAANDGPVPTMAGLLLGSPEFQKR